MTALKMNLTMKTKSNRQYWLERAEYHAKTLQRNETAILRHVRDRYLDITRNYKKAVGEFYGVYATEKSISLAEALKPMTAVEQAKFFKEIDLALKKAGREDGSYLAFLKNTKKQLKVPRITQLSFEAQRLSHQLALYEIELTRNQLEKTMRLSYAFQIKTLEAGLGLQNLGHINTKKIQNAVTKNWSGTMFSDSIWKQKDKLVNTLQNQIQNNFTQNKHIKDSTNELMERFDVKYYEAERLIRTETQRISNEADLQTYIDLGIEKYQFISFIDDRTSAICEGMDNEIFLVTTAVIGVNFPPLHPNCRSRTIAIFD